MFTQGELSIEDEEYRKTARGKTMNVLIRLTLVLFFCTGFSDYSHASSGTKPSSEPILRVESGFHSNIIKRIDVDRAGRYLVTSSTDKTLRLFTTDTGRLIRTMRVPVNLRNDGKLYSVAISPDGSIIATGGWDKLSGDRHSIYLFETNTGEMLTVLSGLDNVINDLVFSDDGLRLAAVLGSDQGLRVFDLTTMTLMAENQDYASNSYGVDFAPDGRLVTACYDGFIRLYDRDINLLKKIRAPEGKRPYEVRFSPDGKEIALGYDDAASVSILSGKDLSLLFSPDISGVDNGDLSKVSWSTDGQTLYAGGMWNKDSRRPIRAWSKKGRGEYQDFGLSHDTITDIKPRPNGGFFVGTSDPMLMALDEMGETIFSIDPSKPDFRDNHQGFLTSYDGGIVKFGYEQWGEKPASFDLNQRLLSVDPSDNPNLESPITSSHKLRLKNWKNKFEPTLNGKKLELERYERSRAAAISPDYDFALIGANWNLRLFDLEGELVWKTQAPATVWGVNISGNGKLALAAFGDGTIRWYSMQDGRELLSFFPHKDQRRWVAWTPSGYYMASTGGEELIGWHINNGGKEAADFFPAALFREKYNRPDVVTAILTSLNEQKAIKIANSMSKKNPVSEEIGLQLPPVIKITAPMDGTEIDQEKITIQYTVKSPSTAPVKQVQILIDGRKTRGINRQSEEDILRGVIELDVPMGKSLVSLIAENKNGSSEPAIIQLNRKAKHERGLEVKGQGKGRGGHTDQDGQEFVIKPKLYLLSVGVSDYDDDSMDLAYAAKDADDFARVFREQEGGLYREVVSKVLTNKAATKDAILDGLEWLERETTAKDITILFIAGHGVNDDHGEYYFLPGDTKIDKLRRTGLPYTEIKRTVANVAGKAIFFIDTCHSGNVMGSRRGAEGLDVDSMVNDLVTAQNGVVVFASSTGRQYSLEDKRWQNGAFTKAIVEGVSGLADYHGHGKISVNMLDLYVSERVKELTGGRQTPTTTKPKTVPDFPIAVKQ